MVVAKQQFGFQKSLINQTHGSASGIWDCKLSSTFFGGCAYAYVMIEPAAIAVMSNLNWYAFCSTIMTKHREKYEIIIMS